MSSTRCDVGRILHQHSNRVDEAQAAMLETSTTVVCAVVHTSFHLRASLPADGAWPASSRRSARPRPVLDLDRGRAHASRSRGVQAPADAAGIADTIVKLGRTLRNWPRRMPSHCDT